MTPLREISAPLDGTRLRFGVVAARFNGLIVERLLEGALECLRRHGVAEEDIVVARVPGAWEIPLGLQALARQGGFAGLIALGVVIRGETPHFDYVCSGCTAGCERVVGEHGLPVGFGLLTCDTSAQAEERAGGRGGNKGWEAAAAALEMAGLLGAMADREGPPGRG